MRRDQAGADGAGQTPRPGDAERGATVRLSCASTFDDVRRMLGAIVAQLEAYGLTREEIGSAEVVIAEALNNIVEHAFLEVPDGRIDLALRQTGRGLYVDIADSGAAMPGGAPPLGDPVDPSAPREDMPEGGFGWFLIRALVHDLDYERTGDVNHLSFRIAVGLDPIAF